MAPPAHDRDNSAPEMSRPIIVNSGEPGRGMKPKLSESKKLQLAKQLSEEDQEAINVVLKRVDFVYDAIEKQWCVLVNGDGKNPYVLKYPGVHAVLNLLRMVQPLPPP
jgi:hypothetical protein